MQEVQLMLPAEVLHSPQKGTPQKKQLPLRGPLSTVQTSQ
jgi:hypothetical protein